MKRKRIGIDASGGDFGYQKIVPGVIEASKTGLYEIVIYGDLAILKRDYCLSSNCLGTIHCDRSNQELERAFIDLEKGYLDAIITAKNSHRLIAIAKNYRQDDVPLPGLLAPLPVKGKTVYMLDAGATNRVNDPKIFLGWARAGYCYLKAHMGIDEPKIGLLNIATERAYAELTMINLALQGSKGYVGYAEPARFFAGEIDLWLMEGFVGNAFLKLIEEVLPLTLALCSEELHGMPLAQLRLYEMAKKRLSYDAHLVSPLIGLKYPVFRVHGCCKANQIAKSFEAIKPYILA